MKPSEVEYSREQPSVKGSGIRTAQAQPDGGQSPPQHRHGHRPQTTTNTTNTCADRHRQDTAAQYPHWESHGPVAYHNRNSPHTRTQITSTVSLISALSPDTDTTAPDSTRLDPTRLQPPWRGHRTTCLEITTRHHHLFRRRPTLGRQHTYLEWTDCLSNISLRPIRSHRTTLQGNASHLNASPRIAWCHRLLQHLAPGLHDSSPAVHKPAAACRPTQLRPHRAAVSTCCEERRQRCSIIGQSSVCLLTRSSRQ